MHVSIYRADRVDIVAIGPSLSEFQCFAKFTCWSPDLFALVVALKPDTITDSRLVGFYQLGHVFTLEEWSDITRPSHD